MILIPKPIMKDNQIESICCGGEHSIMLRQNNDVLVCGDNSYGQIGLAKEIKKVSIFTLLLKDIQISKIQCSFTHSLILKKNSNEFITFGQNCNGQVKQKQFLTKNKSKNKYISFYFFLL